MHTTGPRCTGLHGLRTTAIFYPDFYPKTHRAGIETLYALFTNASRSSRPEHATSLPSCSCRFDSRRPFREIQLDHNRLGQRSTRWRSVTSAHIVIGSNNARSPNPYWAGHVSGRRRRDAERPDRGARAVRRARVKQPDAPSHRLGGGRGPALRGSKPRLCCSGWHDDLLLATTRCLSVGADRGGGTYQGSVRGRILPSPPA